MEHFSQNKDIIDFSVYKKSKYLDEEGRQNINKIQKETQKLLKNYPEYKESIIYYIKDNFDLLDFIINFYQKEYKKT